MRRGVLGRDASEPGLQNQGNEGRAEEGNGSAHKRPSMRETLPYLVKSCPTRPVRAILEPASPGLFSPHFAERCIKIDQRPLRLQNHS